MKKENILVVVVILSIVLAGVMIYINSKPQIQADAIQNNEPGLVSNISSINWQTYTQGMELAKTRNKHIFLYFHADWCTYCTKLKKTTFKNKAVLNYLKENFISIGVDTDKEKDLGTQWGVRGLPTLWFLKPDNSKISNIPGYIDAKQFLNILKYIHTRSYDNMSFQEFVKTL